MTYQPEPTPDTPAPPGMVALTLIPVEVFGSNSYGLCDAHPYGSDCNRAEGYIYRAEDHHGPARPGWQATIYVRTEDLPFFNTRHLESDYTDDDT